MFGQIVQNYQFQLFLKQLFHEELNRFCRSCRFPHARLYMSVPARFVLDLLRMPPESSRFCAMFLFRSEPPL